MWSAPVVAALCGICALLATGVGLLSPGSTPGSHVRVAAVVAALVAVVALVWLEGPARSSARLVTVAVVTGFVALATFPASPVRFSFSDTTIGPGADPVTPGVDDAAGDAAGGSSAGRPAPGTLWLPEGADVDVAGGTVILQLPGGGSVVLGDAGTTADGAALEGSATLVVTDGRPSRDDGGAVGAGVGMGGITLERSDGGRFVVVDGALFEVPAPLDPDAAPPPDHTDALLAVLLAAFALLAFAPPLVRFGERVGVSLVEPAPPAPEPRPAERTVTMEEGLSEVLRSMLADPDPRTAVIGAYARLLRALAEVGHPRQDQEGPHEHLWRTLGPIGVRRAPVHQLAELFVRARFSPKPITEDHRQRAISALADAVADLRLESPEITAMDGDVEPAGAHA